MAMLPAAQVISQQHLHPTTMVLLVLRDPLSPDQGSSIAPSAQQLAGIWLHFPSWPCCRGLSAAWLVCAEKAAV